MSNAITLPKFSFSASSGWFTFCVNLNGSTCARVWNVVPVPGRTLSFLLTTPALPVIVRLVVPTATALTVVMAASLISPASVVESALSLRATVIS